MKEEVVTVTPVTTNYVGNKNSNIFHHDWCKSVRVMKDKNKVAIENREEAVRKGFKPCKICNP